MQFAWYIKDAVSRETCNEIVEKYKNLEKTSGTMIHLKDKDYRKSNIRFVYPKDDITTYNLMHDLGHLVNKQAFGFDLWQSDNAVQYTEYDYKNSGHYDWHGDMDWGRQVSIRKLSVVLQLTDENKYEGGDFEINPYGDQNNAITDLDLRKQGTVIAFPSFIHHRVTPLTSGIRNSLIVWMEGPHFK